MAQNSAKARSRSIIRFARRIVVGISLAFTLLFAIIHGTPILRWYTSVLMEDWNDPEGDILIVLTADTNPDDIVGKASYWRAVYAVRAWRKGHFRTIVVSGGVPPDTNRSLASDVGDFLVGYGIPRDRIVLEERSKNTHENALFTKELIGGWPGTKVLLTSDYHMFRARRAFAAVGLPVLARPVPDLLKDWNGVLSRWDCFLTLSLETLKIANYWERGWLELKRPIEPKVAAQFKASGNVRDAYSTLGTQ